MYYGKLLRQIADAIRQLGGLPQDLITIGKKIDERTKAMGATDEREQQEENVRQERFKEVFAEYKQSERKRTINEYRSYRVQNSLRWATWFAFIAAAIYAFFAHEQLEQARIATEAATKSVEESQTAQINTQSQFDRTMNQIISQTTQQVRAATAAENAVKTTQAQMRLDERAWIAVTAINSPHMPEIDKEFIYTIHFVNTGKTPARNMMIHSGDELLANEKPPNLSLESKEVRLGVLSPGSERTYEGNVIPAARIPSTLTRDDLASLKDYKLSIHGTITYDDIFGCHHWISYCGYLREDWSGYAFCSEHNDAGIADMSCNDK
jgi:hypothetical protein